MQRVIFSGSNDNSFYAIKSDGSLLFSIVTGDKVLSSPSFLVHDGQVYIFFGSNDNMIYAVDGDGNALSGWPVAVNGSIAGSVVFADLDGDGDPEVVAATDMGDVLAYNLDGSHHEGFPIVNEFPFSAAPIIIDMDNDGDMEIIAGSVNSLVALDIKSLGNNDGYWNLFRGNEQRTGYAVFQLDQILGDINGDGILNILDVVVIANILLADDFNTIADMNDDGFLNILDLVILVNIILEI